MSYVKRYVSSHFWDDNYIVNLDPIEKLLFLYFLTNPLSRISGFYEISLKRIAFDTGIDKEMILKIIKRFEKDEKVFYYEGFIILPNYPKYQSLNPNMIKAVKKELEEAPDSIKAFKGFQRLLKHCQTLWNIKVEVKVKYKKKKEIKKKEEKSLSEDFEGQKPDASMDSHACLYLSEFKNVKLTEKEYQKLQSRFDKQIVDEAIEELGAYIASKGKKYKSHYATLLNWIKRKNNKSSPTKSKISSEAKIEAMRQRLKMLEKYSYDSGYKEEAEKLREKIAFLEKNESSLISLGDEKK